MIYVVALVGLYLILVLMLYLGQRKLMYHPGSTLGTPASHGLAEVVPVKLKAGDGTPVTSWFRAAGTNKPIFVYFHGNAGHIGDRGNKVRPYVEAGYGMLLVGYRGYGGNPGTPSENGLYQDAQAALEFLARTGITPDHWILYGESLGTAVAVEMASRYAKDTPVGAVVLEAPFSSMSDAAASHYPYIPVKYLLRDTYDSMSKIDTIASPLYLFHGSRDKTVPQALGRRLFDAAREPKKADWIDGAGHNDLYDFSAAQNVIAFVKDVWTPN